MAWPKEDAKFSGYIHQLFHAEDWQDRTNAARELGLLKDARATNMLSRALSLEKENSVINSIIEAMGRIGDPKATIKIIEKLKEELDKFEGDKFRLIYIIESLKNLKDKRALPYLSPFLNSPDNELKELTIKTFDIIQPDWRDIVKKKEKRSVKEIFETEKQPKVSFRK